MELGRRQDGQVPLPRHAHLRRPLDELYRNGDGPLLRQLHRHREDGRGVPLMRAPIYNLVAQWVGGTEVEAENQP